MGTVHVDEDFSETNDLAAKEPEKLAALVKLWWEEAEKHKVLPLDDRFRERFVVNANRSTALASAMCFMPEWGTCRQK
jgi:hypothetical protein